MCFFVCFFSPISIQIFLISPNKICCRYSFQVTGQSTSYDYTQQVGISNIYFHRATRKYLPEYPSYLLQYLKLTLLCQVDSSTLTLWTSVFITEGVSGSFVLLYSIEIQKYNTNSVDPDQMLHSATLPMSFLRDARHKWVKISHHMFWSAHIISHYENTPILIYR